MPSVKSDSQLQPEEREKAAVSQLPDKLGSPAKRMCISAASKSLSWHTDTSEGQLKGHTDDS